MSLFESSGVNFSPATNCERMQLYAVVIATIDSSACVSTQLEETYSATCDGYIAYRDANTIHRSAASVVSACPPVSCHDFFCSTRRRYASRMDWFVYPPGP